MKNLLVILMGLFFSIQLMGQVVAIAPTKLNVMYVGVDNPISVLIENCSCNDVVLESANGDSIKKVGPCQYTVRCAKPGKNTLIVKKRTGSYNKLIDSLDFRVKVIPDPVATVNGREGGIIQIANLQAAKRVDVTMKNFEFDLNFNVISYIVSTKVADYVIDQKVMGNQITDEVRAKILNRLQVGQKVYFEEIQVAGPDRKARQLGIIMFKVY